VRLIKNGFGLSKRVRTTLSRSTGVYDLNFFAFGIFSPLNNLSAPTFLPLLGQPRWTLHELIKKMVNENTEMRREIRIDFIRIAFFFYGLKRF
jgi:hypothetical protein